MVGEKDFSSALLSSVSGPENYTEKKTDKQAENIQSLFDGNIFTCTEVFICV